MTVRVEFAPGFLNRFAKMPEMEQAARILTVRLALPVARQRAPFDRIREELEVVSGIDAESAVARLNANDWISGFWEYGTERHGAVSFMRPAAELIGRLEKRRSRRR